MSGLFRVPVANGPSQPREESGLAGSRDGRRLFYNVENTVMSVSVRTEGNKLQAGAPQAVVETGQPVGGSWDVEPDGRGFLIIRDEQSAARPTMAKFIFHWFEELKRLAPRK